MGVHPSTAGYLSFEFRSPSDLFTAQRHLRLRNIEAHMRLFDYLVSRESSRKGGLYGSLSDHRKVKVTNVFARTREEALTTLRRISCACLKTTDEYLVIEPAMDMDVSEMEMPPVRGVSPTRGIHCYKVWITFHTLDLAVRGAAADGLRCAVGCDDVALPSLGVHPNWQQEWCACGGRRSKHHRCDHQPCLY